MKSLGILALAAVAAGALSAQMPLEPASIPVAYPLDSGVVRNTGNTPATLWNNAVYIPYAGTIQLVFREAMLASDEDRIVATSGQDGERHVMDRLALKQWVNHSAWFNGPQVTIELVLAPGSSGHVTIDSVLIGAPGNAHTDGSAGGCSYCAGGDPRVLTSEARVCRLVGAAVCSGWLIDDQSTMVTAAHCYNLPSQGIVAPGALVTAQFNVPLSASTGALVAPPVADQYPVLQATVLSASTTPSTPDDWVVCKLGNNSSGQSASSRQGWFTLANSNPAIGTSMRTIGCGADNTPDCTRQNSLQQATGALNNASSTNIEALTQVQQGSSGGVIVDTTTGFAVAIADVCTGGTTGCGAAGPPVTYGPLATAIGQRTNCPPMTLANDVPAMSCGVQTLFSVAPVASRWNVVGLSTPSDWDLQMGTVSSTGGTGSADYVLGDTRAGGLTPTGGTAFRFSGSGAASLHFQSAATTNIDSGAYHLWTGSNVVFKTYEFNVTTPGTYRIDVLGDPTLEWRVFAPATGAGWRPRSTAITTQSVGSGPTAVTLGTVGIHALVVSRPGGSFSPVFGADISSVVSSAAVLNLVENAPVNTNLGARLVTCTPAAGKWNLIGASSGSNWSIGEGRSISKEAGKPNHLVLDGHAAAIPAPNAVAYRTSGSGNASLEHDSGVAWNTNDTAPRTLDAFQAFSLLEFNVPASGNYEVRVDGDPSLSWYVYTPGVAASEWRGIPSAIMSGNVGGTFALSTLFPGTHVLVIAANGGATSSPRTYVPHACLSTGPFLLVANAAPSALTVVCQSFNLTPTAGQWNAVAVQSTSDWDVSIGTVASVFGGTAMDFLVADGNAGTIAPTTGSFTRFSGTTGASGQHVAAGSVGAGVGGFTNVAIGANDLVVLKSVVVSTPQNVDVAVTGAAGFSWRLFKHEPGNAGWRPRAVASGGSTIGAGALTAEPFVAGTHVIAIFRDTATGSGNFTIALTTPAPIPVLTSISPTTLPRNSPSMPLAVNGSSFVATSAITINGATQPTSFVNATQLMINVPSSLLTTAGNLDIAVFTPAPGGGTSGSTTLTVLNPFPNLGSISPSSVTATANSLNLSLSGSNFVSDSFVLFDGAPLTTSFNSASSLGAIVPAGALAIPGTHSIRVNNQGPGGGISNVLTLSVDPAAPTLTSLNPSTLVAGGPQTTLLVNGGGFVGSSVVRWNGAAVPTSLVSATQLSATVSAALLQTAGSIPVTVFTPAPGGGTSSAVNMNVVGPTITGFSPSSIGITGSGSLPVVITGANFLPSSTVVLNGASVPSSVQSSTQMTATLIVASVPQATRPGGIAVNVANTADAVSNTAVIRVGSPPPLNVGTIRRQPLVPVPGGTYAAVLEGCTPFQIFSLYADLANVPPLLNFPSPAAGLALAVSPLVSPGPFLPLIEGLGVFGPATPIPLDAQGRFILPGITLPNPAINLTITVQAAYLDPAAPIGLRLTHAKWPDTF